ncbi:hypothetical protein V6Z11_D13G117700 [Gossypium hirsutum]
MILQSHLLQKLNSSHQLKINQYKLNKTKLMSRKTTPKLAANPKSTQIHFKIVSNDGKMILITSKLHYQSNNTIKLEKSLWKSNFYSKLRISGNGVEGKFDFCFRQIESIGRWKKESKIFFFL